MQAAICSRFGVAWHLYDRLTLRELRVLLSAIEEENGDESPPSGRPRAGERQARPGERIERVL